MVPPVDEQIRALIFRMAAENPTWGAPRIHGELLKLGFQVSEPTVSRWPSPQLARGGCAGKSPSAGAHRSSWARANR